jgi:hypothetical protein
LALHLSISKEVDGKMKMASHINLDAETIRKSSAEKFAVIPWLTLDTGDVADASLR